MDTKWNNVPSDARTALGVMDALARTDYQVRAVYLIRATIVQNADDSKRLKALMGLRDQWEADAKEHLFTFGQNLPASVECLVEQFDEIMRDELRDV